MKKVFQLVMLKSDGMVQHREHGSTPWTYSFYRILCEVSEMDLFFCRCGLCLDSCYLIYLDNGRDNIDFLKALNAAMKLYCFETRNLLKALQVWAMLFQQHLTVRHFQCKQVCKYPTMWQGGKIGNKRSQQKKERNQNKLQTLNAS